MTDREPASSRARRLRVHGPRCRGCTRLQQLERAGVQQQLRVDLPRLRPARVVARNGEAAGAAATPLHYDTPMGSATASSAQQQMHAAGLGGCAPSSRRPRWTCLAALLGDEPAEDAHAANQSQARQLLVSNPQLTRRCSGAPRARDDQAPSHDGRGGRDLRRGARSGLRVRCRRARRRPGMAVPGMARDPGDAPAARRPTMPAVRRAGGTLVDLAGRRCGGVGQARREAHQGVGHDQLGGGGAVDQQRRRRARQGVRRQRRAAGRHKGAQGELCFGGGGLRRRRASMAAPRCGAIGGVAFATGAAPAPCHRRAVSFISDFSSSRRMTETITTQCTSCVWSSRRRRRARSRGDGRRKTSGRSQKAVMLRRKAEAEAPRLFWRRPAATAVRYGGVLVPSAMFRPIPAEHGGE